MRYYHLRFMSMSRFMRMLVMFDLPVGTKRERQFATSFRQSLIKDGFYMVQFSVYARVCNGNDAVKKHENRLRRIVPDNGSIRVLTITEKQYQDMIILLGEHKKEEKKFEVEQLTLF